MSPAALTLALALHGLALAALWWMTPFQPPEPPQEAIMVTVQNSAPPGSAGSPSDETPADRPAVRPDPGPPEPPREEPQQAMAEPRPPEPPSPQPRSPDSSSPESSSPEPPVAEPPAPQPPPPGLEAALAPPDAPPPPDFREVPTKRLPLPPWPAPRPPQTTQTPPPPPKPPQPAPRPPSAPASVQAPPSNSVDWLMGNNRVRNAYLDQVARLTSKYRHYPRGLVEANQRGRVVTRVTITRDGRLVDVSIETSSGWPAIDAAELEAIRRSAPFPPVPPDMPGDPLVLILPLNFLALAGNR